MKIKRAVVYWSKCCIGKIPDAGGLYHGLLKSGRAGERESGKNERESVRKNLSNLKSQI
jgi:hypothetical protein